MKSRRSASGDGSHESNSREENRRAAQLLKLISLGEEDVKAGRVMTQQEVFAGIERCLKQR